MKIRFWKSLSRHPLSQEYEDLRGYEWEDYVAGVEKHGVIQDRQVIIYEGMVLDGWQLQRACVQLDTKPHYKSLPKGINPSEFVVAMNDHRRHEDLKTRQERRKRRIERVAGARAEGKSTRTISKEEGISETQVRRDLQNGEDQGVGVQYTNGQENGSKPISVRKCEAGTTEIAFPSAPYGAPEHEEEIFCSACLRRQRLRVEMPSDCPECRELREHRPEEEQKVRHEGKHRPKGITSPKSNGRVPPKEIYNHHAWEAAWGVVVRAIEVVGNMYGASQSRSANVCRSLLKDYREAFQGWRETLQNNVS
jgi:hypothetical protein